MAATLCAAATPALAQRTWSVPSGGDLQGVLNAAQPGDTILLAAGGTYVGNFTLPVKPGGAFITLRSSAPDTALPGPGARIHPGYAGALPVLRSPNTMPVIRTAPGAHHYRLLFLALAANAQGGGDILSLGDGSRAQSTPAHVPYELVLDRVLIQGDPNAGQKRAISLHSASTSIVNSYIADIKAVGQDSQAIAGWNGPGPYLIGNNYLEAAGENILFGGADPAIPGLVPSDITIAGNHLSKPLAWRGSAWQVKNLLELKSGQRVVIDRNVMENNWAAAQTGYAILLKSENQDGGAPWTVVQDVRITNNVVRNVSSAINILGRSPRYPALVANTILVRNNLFVHVSAAQFGGHGRLLLINGGAHIVFDHNTAITDGSSAVYAYGEATAGFQLTSNIILNHEYGIMGGDTAPGHSTIARYFPGSYVAGNVIAGPASRNYPAANYYPASLGAVGFVNPSGDYRLAADSPYRHAAVGGGDPGANHAHLPGGQAGPAPAAAMPAATGSAEAPLGLTATVAGSVVHVEWQRPASTAPSSYVLEAGTSPGTSNAARVDTGAATSLTARAVPPGVYYVRVRSVRGGVASAPSAEIRLVVGATDVCAAAPAAPGGLRAIARQLTVELQWAAPGGGCAPGGYRIVAGSRPGLDDLGQMAVGALSATATAPAGTYYVRVVAVNAWGISAPSNEVAVTLRP